MRIGGLTRFGEVPDWVDAQKPPGTSSQMQELGLASTLKKICTLEFFVFAPNAVWFAIALLIHLLAPYEIHAASAGWAGGWVARRLALNFAVGLAYYGYFYVSLYLLGWANRKYQPGVYPTAANMAHNLWYWGLGVCQWTAWECIVTRLWATQKVPYVTDAEVLSSAPLLAWNVAWVLLVPIWRDVHFYLAHRFIHIRAVYRFVHALHHRNPDPEPFSGMTMHPVEHLYYFSNALFPTLYLPGLSPIVFLYIFVHLALAPAAGHSGWEDHFQADQYHYVHHAKFECNYGSPSTGFIDQWCGTFREALGDSKAYKGEWVDKKDDDANATAPTATAATTAATTTAATAAATAATAPAATRVWSKEGYLGLPADTSQAAYTLFYSGLAGLFAWAVVSPPERRALAAVPTPTLIAAAVAFGPVAFALVLCWVCGDRMPWRWPFQKERLLGQFGFFLVFQYLGVLLPVFHAAKWVVAAEA